MSLLGWSFDTLVAGWYCLCLRPPGETRSNNTEIHVKVEMLEKMVLEMAEKIRGCPHSDNKVE